MKLTTEATRNFANIVHYMLSGAYTTSIENFPYHTTVHVYKNGEQNADSYQFQVAINSGEYNGAFGYSVSTLSGEVLTKGVCASELARFLREQKMLATWIIADESAC